MLINTIHKEIKVNKVPVRENVTTWIEQDIIVPDSKPDAIKVVAVNVNSYVSDAQALDGKVKVAGKLNYFVLYKTTDGSMISLPYTSDFTQILTVKDITKEMRVFAIPRVKNVIHSLPNERKVSVKTEVLFRIMGVEYADMELLEDFTGDVKIEKKLNPLHFHNIMQNKSTNIASKEDVMLPNENTDMKEIIKMDANIINQEYKESYNKIMLKADIDVTILYLTNNPETEIRKFNITLPITGMIELENINDTNQYNIRYSISDLMVKANPDMDSKTINMEYDVKADITVYNEEEATFVSDFYSENMDLSFEPRNSTIMVNENNYTKYIDVKENLSNAIPVSSKIVDYSVDTNYLTTKVANGNVMVEGTIKINLLLQNIDTMEVESKMVEILITETIPLDNFKENKLISFEIIPEKVNVSQNGTDIEVKTRLELKVAEQEMTDIDMVDKIEAEEVDLSKLNSMYIYIVKPKDTLWSIAKRYKTTVDKIAKTNNIDDVDKINVGDKLLIIR